MLYSEMVLCLLCKKKGGRGQGGGRGILNRAGLKKSLYKIYLQHEIW